MELVREIYSEALNIEYNGIKTVKDFHIVFNAYITFEKDMYDSIQKGQYSTNGEDGQIVSSSSNIDAELEKQLARMDKLLSRRPFILSDVILWSSPNDVDQWLKRIALCIKHSPGNSDLVLETYKNAI